MRTFQMLLHGALVASLALGCKEGSPKGRVEPPHDSGEAVKESGGEPDTGRGIDFDSADTEVPDVVPVDPAFVSSLASWSLQFRGEWGNTWRVGGVGEGGDLVMSASQLPVFYLEPDTTYVFEVGAETFPLSVIVDHWRGADCTIDCESCDRYGPVGYRATEGQIELSLWEDHADFRFTNLSFAPQFEGGEIITVPLIEVTDVPYTICEYDDTW